jgi:hypothetical protein
VAHWVVLLLTAGASRVFAQIEMTQVAVLRGIGHGSMPCGDANHNGMYEIYSGSVHDSLLIYEHLGNNQYRELMTTPVVGWVDDAGFENSDSLFDLLTTPGEIGPHTVMVYESARPDTYPLTPVWGGDPPIYANHVRFTDLDQDGHPEITIGNNIGMGFFFYEDLGGNDYEPWQHPFPQTAAAGDFTTGDFDCDGRQEIATGTIDGALLVFKCLGKDSFARVCSLDLSPVHEIENYAFATANDWNGKPEIINLSVAGDDVDSCSVRIYEAQNDSQYACVWDTQYLGVDVWNWAVTAGDLDGDGIEEIVVSSGADIRIFKCTGPARYEQVWQYDMGGLAALRIFDLNGDGRNELVLAPYIFEDTEGLGVAEFTRLTQLHSVAVQPTIARLGTPVMFSGVPPGADIVVHSLDGRLVSRASGVRQPTWTWDLRDQAGNLVPAGTYFAVIRSKGRTTSLKLCLVK